MTYPLSTLGPTVSTSGVSAPTYADILASLQVSAQGIFGADVYLGEDSQDGQLIAIFARAIHDCNQACLAIYQGFSPSYAQGVSLSNLVSINGLVRKVSSRSQCFVVLGGTPGTTVVAGKVMDDSGSLWSLPSVVVIPSSGAVTVTATCDIEGSVVAGVGAITQIVTPTRGWVEVTNTTAASRGAPVETDAELRQRRALSVALASRGTLTALNSALLAVAGTTRVSVFENTGNTTDARGLPAHSIACVVVGGAAEEIAHVLLVSKPVGVYLHGTTTLEVSDEYGTPFTCRWFVPTLVPVRVQVTLQAQSGYTSAVGDNIRSAVAAYVESLADGKSVEVARLYPPALLYGASDNQTYSITSIEIAEGAGPLGVTTIPILFAEEASCSVDDVTVVLV